MRIICYHYPCPDGAFAALAAAVGLTPLPDSGVAPSRPQTQTRFQPLTVFQPIPERLAITESFTNEDDVYLLDFSGGPEFLRAACARAARVCLCDHHKTAQEDVDAMRASGTLPENLHMLIDMNRSGAGIARDVFRLREALAEPVRERVLRMFAYVEDNDLWRHALPASKECAAGVHHRNLRLDVNEHPGLWDALLSLDPESLIEEGRAALHETDRIVAAEAATAFKVRLQLPGMSSADAPLCLCVLSSHPEHRSILGNALAERSAALGLAPVGMVAYVEPGMGDAAATHLKVSVRSVRGWDTTAFTRAHGGGGHAAASSAVVSRAVFDGWRVGG